MALIVLTFLGTSGSWHVDADDPDCDASVAHNHSAHHERLVRPATAAAATHCAICHWLQSFRSDGARHGRADIARASRSTALTAPLVAIRSADRLNLPSRAPPTT